MLSPSIIMKSGLSFGAVLLAAGLTGATPSANNGVVRDLVVAEPALALRQAWNVIRDLSAQAIDAAQGSQTPNLPLEGLR